ncbi:hypothetical protein OPV22_026409 [Ensete ventricosum]|uniref:Uncharacterized protein n=1 Tax=Ensete ventricosum TaxID=4639 RepID=A0AAV8P8H1_ENSVE|nr:hypothetical protein OPV22_026409 [Ensete ventricosum]
MMPQPQQPVSVDGSSEADGADHGAAGPRRPYQWTDIPDQSKLLAHLQGFNTSRISGHSGGNHIDARGLSVHHTNKLFFKRLQCAIWLCLLLYVPNGKPLKPVLSRHEPTPSAKQNSERCSNLSIAGKKCMSLKQQNSGCLILLQESNTWLVRVLNSLIKGYDVYTFCMSATLELLR